MSDQHDDLRKKLQPYYNDLPIAGMELLDALLAAVRERDEQLDYGRYSYGLMAEENERLREQLVKAEQLLAASETALGNAFHENAAFRQRLSLTDEKDQ